MGDLNACDQNTLVDLAKIRNPHELISRSGVKPAPAAPAEEYEMLPRLQVCCPMELDLMD
ncbi:MULTISPECIES: hypothetical protein [Bradyrhizobium]|uniref:hypothetical protein n=1 Tax=Bradyrhizobium TaxID=374 RepID=UPI0004107FEB|nr:MULTISPECIES: hypothetical protein [Bradyrhizobium]UFW51443.1 hypothetical protein BaraCB756_10890 [Bradyrhizobium arachidis]